MADSSVGPKPRRRRRWLQFSLRSLLLLTTLAAVGTWWYLRPEPLERQLPDGMKLRAPVVVIENEKTKEKVSKNHGPFVVLDRHGRTLVKGFYDNDQPAGQWAYYHLDGRKALAGPCVEGCRTGVWTAWDESGRKQADVEHGEPVVAFFSGKSILNSGGIGGGLPKVAVRQGASREWWDNGQPRSLGPFQQDRGHGSWTFWNRDGVKTAEGELRNGVRHGQWTMPGEKSQPPRVVQYVHGREVLKLEKLLAELESQLQSDDWHVRHDAVTALSGIGREGVPLLLKALQAGDAELRLSALESLAQLGPDAKSALVDIESLTRHADASVRFEALLAVFNIAEDRRGDVFKQLVTRVSSSNANEQTLQVERLAQLGSPLLPILEVTLQHGDAPAKYLTLAVIAKMLEDAAYGLYQPKDSITVQMASVLLTAAQEDADPRVSSSAKFILDNPPMQPMGGISGGFF